MAQRIVRTASEGVTDLQALMGSTRHLCLHSETRYKILASNKEANMITEIAQVQIKPGTEKDYEAAVAKAAALPPAKGNLGFELHRSIEKPHRYLLIAKWDTVDDHLAFRASEGFAEWRALVGPYFASPPEVEHTETVVSTDVR